jgi:signal transduction histidine kinase/ActR/RegA family two-component response regulator
LLLVDGFVGYQNASRLAQQNRWVDHSYQVLMELEGLLSTLKDAETGQRGYLLTLDERYLEPHTAAVRRMPAALARLRRLTADNPKQQERTAAFEKTAAARLEVIRRTIDLAREGDPAEATALIRSDLGRRLMDDLRRQVAVMQADEQALLRRRAADSAATYRNLVGSIFLTTLTGLVLVSVILTLTLRHARARERTAAIFADQQERLRATRLTELTDINRRQNEFLATLAHELRNPLAPIRNALEVIKLSGVDDETVMIATAMIERQVSQMVRFVDDLLDVSRISRGKIELRKGRIELASAILHAVEAAQPLCDNLGNELTVSLPPQPLYLEADPARIAQVVGNLLNNSCKFTDRGGRIALVVEREGDEAVIRVRDTGIGLAAEQLPHIFDLFMQVDTSLERAAGGLGIGLKLVKTLVDLHGGSVEAHSDGLGHGSEFVVRLPLLAEAVPSATPPVAAAPAARTPHRVLVVDDNRDAANSLARLLRLKGHDVRIAHDGVEAVAAAAELRPELVLCDLGMPKQNGYEVARRIREQPWGRDVLLVAVTGWGQEEFRQRSKEAGFDDHLVKPVDVEAFNQILASLDRTGAP